MKVVSFLPSATEIVFALGVGDRLVGRSHECDYPAEVRSLPIVMRALAVSSSLKSAEIHAYVQERMKDHAALYAIEEDVLARLDPDVILTQDLCHVCSITPDELEGILLRSGRRPKQVVLRPTKLAHLFRDISRVAEALDVPERGKALVADLRRRLEAASGTSSGRAAPEVRTNRPRVALLEWLDPPIVAGLWADDMIKEAGGAPVLSKSGATSNLTTWDALRGAGLDLLVISPCAFPVERTLGELRGPTLHPLEDLHPSRGVWVADEAFFSRPGPRLIEGVELLVDLLQGQGRPRRSFEGRAVPAFRSPLPSYRIPTRR